jgi:hypothetical protein
LSGAALQNYWFGGRGMAMGCFLVVVGPLLVIVGACTTAWPREVWHLLQGWRYADPEAMEPSDAGYALHRVGGVLQMVAGAGLTTWGMVGLMAGPSAP